MKNYYANVMDLTELSDPIRELVMTDWFDKSDIIRESKRIDDIWVRIVGRDLEQIEARVAVLRKNKSVRNSGGVRIKIYKEKKE